MSEQPNGGALCYLATPYTRHKDGIEGAFRAAARLTAMLLRAGVKCYSPIAHTHPVAIHGMIDPLDHAIWLPFDEAMMTACHVLIVAHMDGWSESKGVAHEIEFFTKAGKPIFDLDPLSLTMAKRAAPKLRGGRFESMSLAELHDERGYWDTQIRESKSWGAALTAASEFRDECDVWIRRRTPAAAP